MRRLPVYCNPTSGGGAGAQGEVGRALEEAGLAADLRRIDPGDWEEELRRVAAAGEPALGVCGGDGTVSAAAGVLAGTDTALVGFPGGTLNHFAVALGVDTHAAAAEAVAAERYERVDVGEVNDRVFVNGVSIGLYPRSLRIRREWEQTLGCTRKRWSWSC